MPFVITFLTRLARQDDVIVHHRSTSHPPHDHILFDQSPLARVIKRTPSNYLGICYSTILPSRRTKLDVSSWKLVLLGLLYRFSLFSSPGELFPTTCSSLIHPSYTHSCHGPFFSSSDIRFGTNWRRRFLVIYSYPDVLEKKNVFCFLQKDGTKASGDGIPGGKLAPPIFEA